MGEVYLYHYNVYLVISTMISVSRFNFLPECCHLDVCINCELGLLSRPSPTQNERHWGQSPRTC